MPCGTLTNPISALKNFCEAQLRAPLITKCTKLTDNTFKVALFLKTNAEEEITEDNSILVQEFTAKSERTAKEKASQRVLDLLAGGDNQFIRDQSIRLLKREADLNAQTTADTDKDNKFAQRSCFLR